MPSFVLNSHKAPQCRQPSLSTSTRKPSGMPALHPRSVTLQAGQGASATTGAGTRAVPREESMSVFVYVNTAKQIGDVEHLKIFATEDAAKDWLDENDPEGVAFEYEVLGSATGNRGASD